MRRELLILLLCICGTAAVPQSKLTVGSIVPEESVLQATAREHQPGPPTLLTVEPSAQQQLQAGMFRTLAGESLVFRLLDGSGRPSGASLPVHALPRLGSALATGTLHMSSAAD